MSQDTKEAIQQAQKTLDKERKEQLQREVYEYLKSQLELIESHKERKAFHEGQIRVYEENIKNVKTGNLEAIEKRRKALNQPILWNFTSTSTGFNPHQFFNNFVAGTVIDINGKQIIF